MAKYIMLISWTGEGIKAVKESPNRLAMAKQAFQAAGAEIEQFFLVMGRYDMIAVGEAPDDETVAKLRPHAWLGWRNPYRNLARIY